MSSLRVKPASVQAKRQKSFAFTDNNGSTSYAFYPEDASMMEIAKAIYKDSGASCWPLKIDGIPLIEYNFDASEDIIHEVEWSPSQAKMIEQYRKALENAIEETKASQEAATAMSNAQEPNRGLKGGPEAAVEQATNTNITSNAEKGNEWNKKDPAAPAQASPSKGKQVTNNMPQTGNAAGENWGKDSWSETSTIDEGEQEDHQNETTAKSTTNVDLDTPREPFSERRAAEVETLFSSLISSCLDNLDEIIASMIEKKVELLEEKARIEATIAALEERLNGFKVNANELVEGVDPFEEDVEVLKQAL